MGDDERNRAALALSSRILDGRIDWADAFGAWRPHELSGIPTAMKLNLEVGLNLAKGWITPVTRWGDADESWECPLHGSRFAPDGKLLEGPATRDFTAAQQ